MNDNTAAPGDAQLPAEELLELGRDREAVAAAHRSSGPTTDGVQQLGAIIPALRALVAAAGPDDLDRPTPCAAFPVSGVLEHMIGGATAFAPAFLGEAAPATAPGGTPQARFDQAMAGLLDAVRSPGAQERTIASPFGEVPGSMFARYVAFDGLMHLWDLATATGHPVDVDDDLVADVDAFARGLLVPEIRDGDTFAAETEAPAGASAVERLAAFSGRTVPVGAGR